MLNICLNSLRWLGGGTVLFETTYKKCQQSPFPCGVVRIYTPRTVTKNGTLTLFAGLFSSVLLYQLWTAEVLTIQDAHCTDFCGFVLVERCVLFYVMCLIVVPLPRSKGIFAVKISNNNNNNNNNNNSKRKPCRLSPQANYTGRDPAACRRS
jgi:hypothetical protein